MSGPYGKKELIDGAYGYFGVGSHVVAGALSPYAVDATFSIEEAQETIEAWLGHEVPGAGGGGGQTPNAGRGITRAHAPTGVATTDGAVIRDAISDTPEGGLVELASGGADDRYVYEGDLDIGKSLTITGTGIGTVGEGVTGQGNGPLAAPWLRGTVLQPVTPGQNGIKLTGVGSNVHLRDFGIVFDDAIAFLNTGHGILAEAPVWGAGGHDTGLMNPLWENLMVWGQDGNHYAYRILNSLNGTFRHLRAFGGGGIQVECDSFRTLTGNMVLDHPYVWAFAGGSAHGYSWKARNAGGSLGMLGHVHVIRPQCNFDDVPAPLAARGIPAGTTAQYLWHRDDNGAGGGRIMNFNVRQPDLENQQPGVSHLVDFGSGQDNIYVDVGGAFLGSTPPQVSTIGTSNSNYDNYVPTITVGTAAGTGGTVIHSDALNDEKQGRLQIVAAGTPPTPTGSGADPNVCVLDWVNAWSIKRIMLTPENYAATGINWYPIRVTGSQWRIRTREPLVAGVTYWLSYAVEKRFE